MQLSIKKFNETHIPLKIKWVNDPDNNEFLHYDIPLEKSKTLNWYKDNKDRSDRADYTIYNDNQPIGLVGLIDIDYKNRKAEYYILIGEKDFKGKGVAASASKILFTKYFFQHNLNKIYLFTEVDNKAAQRLFEKLGFVQEGLLKDDLIIEKQKIDRIVYRLLAEEFDKRG